MTIKNFWSLQAGEVVVANKIKQHLGKGYEIFFPLNNQLRDIDLVIVNLNTKKIATMQIKESREYKIGEGDGWTKIKAQKVTNRVADFYAFLVYSIQENKTALKMDARTIIVPAEILLEKSKHKIVSKAGEYNYYFAIKGNHAFEKRDAAKNPIDYSKYIDNFDLLKSFTE